MYNNVYQEYINDIIGSMPQNQSSYEIDIYRNSNYFQNNNTTNVELERFYPDLYKLLYPMVRTACMRNTKPITEETINEMVKDIYSNFHSDDAIVLNINLTNDVRSNSKTKEASKVSNAKSTYKVSAETRNTEQSEERNLRPNNYVLNDLIRILVIRELLGRPENVFPIRPVFASQGLGTGIPSFVPRDIGVDRQNYDIYEYLNF